MRHLQIVECVENEAAAIGKREEGGKASEMNDGESEETKEEGESDAEPSTSNGMESVSDDERRARGCLPGIFAQICTFVAN